MRPRPEALRPAPPALYAIADGDAFGGLADIADGGAAGRMLVDGVEALAQAGIGWIQIRLKNGSDLARYGVVERVLGRLEGSVAALWIDDRADLAVLFGASRDGHASIRGLHVGQSDLPPQAARSVVGGTMWIGLSCHVPRLVAAGDADPDVDVLAIGPVFSTRSKRDADPVVGLDGVAAARRATAKPLVAIGGIGPGKIAQVLEAGADSAVVLGAFLARGTGPAGIERTARSLLAEAR